eukprot:TRINITY_DN3138_c0_g1_i1.p1 TRINITY_DN3138_c0_g1~~TRINITY_DN3138_c0_g1_i1.p1  ORF type:complete len:927 (+),score=171.81 TRINITY_DN3138_c0_g1_i1:1194-3974(+)
MSSDDDTDSDSSIQTFDELPGMDSTKGTENIRLGTETAMTESVALDDTTTEASSESATGIEIEELADTSDHSDGGSISLREELPTAPRTPQKTAGRPPRPPRPASPAGLDLPVYRFDDDDDDEPSPPSKPVAKKSKALPPPVSPKVSPAVSPARSAQASPARSVNSQHQHHHHHHQHHHADTTDDEKRHNSDSAGVTRSNSASKKLRRHGSVQSNSSRRSTSRNEHTDPMEYNNNNNTNTNNGNNHNRNYNQPGSGYDITDDTQQFVRGNSAIDQHRRYDQRVETVNRQLNEIDDRLATRLPKHSHCQLHHPLPQHTQIIRHSSPLPTTVRPSDPTDESIRKITEAILAKTGLAQPVHRYESPQTGRKPRNKFMRQTQSAVAKRKPSFNVFTSGNIDEPKSIPVNRYANSSNSLTRVASHGPSEGNNSLTKDELNSLRQLAAAVKVKLSPTKASKEKRQQQQLSSVIDAAFSDPIPAVEPQHVSKRNPIPEDTKIAGSRRTQIRSYSSMSDRKKYLRGSKKTELRSRTPPASGGYPVNANQTAMSVPYMTSPTQVMPPPPSGGWVWVPPQQGYPPPQSLGVQGIHQGQGQGYAPVDNSRPRPSEKSHSRHRRSEKISTSRSSSYYGMTSTTTCRSSSVSTIENQHTNPKTTPQTTRTPRPKPTAHRHLHADHVDRRSRRDQLVENDQKRWKQHSNITNHVNHADDIEARKDRLKVIKTKIKEAFECIDTAGTGFVTIEKAEKWLHECESNLGSRRPGRAQVDELLVDFVGVSFLPALRMSDVRTFTFEGAFKAFDSFKKGYGYHPFLTGKKPMTFPNDDVLDRPVISERSKQLAKTHRTRNIIDESQIKHQMCTELSQTAFSPSIAAITPRDGADSVVTSLPSPPTPNSPTLSLSNNIRVEDPKRKLKIDILLSRISSLAKEVKQG